MRKFSVRWWVVNPRERYDRELMLLWGSSLVRTIAADIVKGDTRELREQYRAGSLGSLGLKFHSSAFAFIYPPL